MHNQYPRFLSTLFVAVLAGCSAKSSATDTFVVHNTSVAVAGTTRIVTSGRNLAFLASEGSTGAGGTDFNADGDKIDTIAVAVEMAAHREHNLAVAALDLAWIGNELYLVVDEALDGHDWNGNLDRKSVV